MSIKMKKGCVLLLAWMLCLTGCGNVEAPAGASAESTETRMDGDEEAGKGPEESERESGGEEDAGGAENGKETDSLESVEAQEPMGSKESVNAKEPEEAKGFGSSRESEEAGAFREVGQAADGTGGKPNAEASAASGAKETQSQARTQAQEASGAKESSGTKTEASNVGTPGGSSSAQGTQSQIQGTAHTCTWDGGKVTTAATCSSEGVKTYTCTSCGKTRTEAVAKTAHSMTTETVAMTCSQPESKKVYCSVCGYVESETATGTERAAHRWVRKGLSYGCTAETCTTGGTYLEQCETCGTYRDEYYPPLGHLIQNTVVIFEGDCTHEGTEQSTCSRCGEVFTTATSIRPDVHDYVTVRNQFPSYFIEKDDGVYDVYYQADKCSRCNCTKEGSVTTIEVKDEG